MYLFSRTRQARPDKVLDAMPAAAEIASKVTQITGLDIYVWTYRFGEPFGTMMWSCRVDSQAQLFEATEKLTADATYVDMALSMTDYYDGPALDGLFRVVSGTPSPEPRKFLSVTRATMRNGKYAEAMEFGVGMQEFVAAELDCPTMFGSVVHGAFADVGWIFGAESMDQIDAFADWQATNEEFAARIQSASDLFVEGSGQDALIEKIN